ncbi:MAG: hypothetical protein IKE23_00880, partial [Exiguobacterium sp.]|nr:hypothetical protein [Exiguobacterium sp.]
VEQYIVVLSQELEEGSAVDDIASFLEENCPASDGATAEVQAMVDGKVGNFNFEYSGSWNVIPPIGFSAGGGGGDFKTASVHLVAYNGVNPVGIYINQDDNSNLFGIFDNGVGFNGSLQTDGGEGAPTEITADLLMYGDSVACSIYGNFISVTGGASYSDDDYTLTITGDCTVTLEFND